MLPRRVCLLLGRLPPRQGCAHVGWAEFWSSPHPARNTEQPKSSQHGADETASRHFLGEDRHHPKPLNPYMAAGTWPRLPPPSLGQALEGHCSRDKDPSQASPVPYTSAME